MNICTVYLLLVRMAGMDLNVRERLLTSAFLDCD